jgi:hypothetical protein
MGLARNEQFHDDLSFRHTALRSEHALCALPRRVSPPVGYLAPLLSLEDEPPPMTGEISRLANTHGSSWGKIRLSSAPREIFFNLQSMIEEKAFWTLEVGHPVEFEEELDRTNGTRATQVRAIVASATS